jgi:hypothetical protein
MMPNRRNLAKSLLNDPSTKIKAALFSGHMPTHYYYLAKSLDLLQYRQIYYFVVLPRSMISAHTLSVSDCPSKLGLKHHMKKNLGVQTAIQKERGFLSLLTPC